MNQVHRWICSSRYWKKRLESKVLPWALDGFDLGQNVLEIGPGVGLTTDWLRRRLIQLTVVEIDSRLVHSLGRSIQGTNVRAVQGDGTVLPFRDKSFSGAVAFTMLHHVRSAELQNRLLREICRVIRPGAVFVGVDSLGSWVMRLLHAWDTLVPVEPATLPTRLDAAGFTSISVVIGGRAFRFAARRR